MYMVYKGCQKRIIMLKSTGSELFDEAYFILKERAEKSPHITESDMVKEANRIISDNILGNRRNRSGSPARSLGNRILLLKWYAAGVLSCGTVVGIIALISNL